MANHIKGIDYPSTQPLACKPPSLTLFASLHLLFPTRRRWSCHYRLVILELKNFSHPPQLFHSHQSSLTPLQLPANLSHPPQLFHNNRSSLYAPAASCQILSARSCSPFPVRGSVSPGWPYATDPSFPPHVATCQLLGAGSQLYESFQVDAHN